VTFGSATKQLKHEYATLKYNEFCLGMGSQIYEWAWGSNPSQGRNLVRDF